MIIIKIIITVIIIRVIAFRILIALYRKFLGFLQ